MFQTDQATAVSSLPTPAAAGTEGYFTGGNPGAGTPATVVDADFLNMLMMEAVNVATASGNALSKTTYNQMITAIKQIYQENLAASAVAGGTSDALTASFTPAITSTTLASGNVQLSVRAATANLTTTPTFTPAPGTITAQTIIKGIGQPLAPGDIAGAGHWIDLTWDATLGKWVLLNPATGISGLVASGITTVTVTGTLASTVVGGTVLINSSSATTQTLPAASTVSIGKRVEFLNTNTGVGTVSRAGSDTITVNNGTVTTLALGAGDTLTLESNGSNGWNAVGGSVQLGSALKFGSSLSANGYQKLPSGLIIQWGNVLAVGAGSGAAATFPIAFPNSFLSAVASFVNSSGISAAAAGGWGGSGTTGMTVFNNGNSAASEISWIAIGY